MISTIPKVIQHMFSDAIWRVKSSPNVYLTFDDGPIPEVTSFVLEVLSKYDVKATFFCVGENVIKFPSIYQRIVEEGHAVGNHSHNHLNGWKTETKAYIENIDLANNHIQSSLFRPPYGKLKPKQYRLLKKKYDVVMWDVLSLDYDQNVDSDKCFNLVKKHTRAGSIIVFHDNIKAYTNLVETLPRVIEYILSKGWKLDTLRTRI